MLPEHKHLADQLATKFTDEFERQLPQLLKSKCRLRVLLECVIEQSMFAERWGEIVDSKIAAAPVTP
jgi:hypothetical protein